MARALAIAVTARALAIVAMLAGATMLAGCGAPTPLPCSDDVVCGGGGACVAGFCAASDPTCASGLRYHDSAGSLAGECTSESGGGGGSGGGPATSDVYVLAENNVVDASMARDDVAPSCAAPGGKDVMFDVNVTDRLRLYVDTFGSTYGVVLAVYSGRCAALTSTSAEMWCVQASCSTTVQQWSEILTPGSYCVVVDQLNVQETPAKLVVRSKLGMPSPIGNKTNQTNLQNTASTCTPNVVKASCNTRSAGEASWFFMSCGGPFFADTCDDLDFEGYITAFGLGAAPLGCATGCSGPPVSTTLAEPSPVWIVADDVSTMACSAVTVYVAMD
jgi:hypothetical protein